MNADKSSHETEASALARPVVSMFSFANAAILIRSNRDRRLLAYARAWAGRGFKVYLCRCITFASDKVKPGEVYFVVRPGHPFALVGVPHAAAV